MWQRHLRPQRLTMRPPLAPKTNYPRQPRILPSRCSQPCRAQPRPFAMSSPRSPPSTPRAAATISTCIVAQWSRAIGLFGQIIPKRNWPVRCAPCGASRRPAVAGASVCAVRTTDSTGGDRKRAHSTPGDSKRVHAPSRATTIPVESAPSIQRLTPLSWQGTRTGQRSKGAR